MKRLSLLLAGMVAIGYGSFAWAANAFTQGAVHLRAGESRKTLERPVDWKDPYPRHE